MHGNPAQPQQGGFDWYDFWQVVNMAGTALSVVALLGGGKEAKQAGQLGTLLGVGSTVAQRATTPPRCSVCQQRMTRPSRFLASGPPWVCGCGNALWR